MIDMTGIRKEIDEKIKEIEISMKISTEEFIAEDGQTTFVLKESNKFNTDNLTVEVGGVEQHSPENFVKSKNENGEMVITFNEGLPKGMDVKVGYYGGISDLNTVIDEHIDNQGVHVTKEDKELLSSLSSLDLDFIGDVKSDGSVAMKDITIGSRARNSTVGANSFAQGGNVIASGAYSHSEGYSTKAIGRYSHTEGDFTVAEGVSAHAEGTFSVANGDYSHAQGFCSYAGFGTLYTVNRSDNSLKTITLDRVDGLLVGDKLDLKSYGNGEYTLLNVPITAIEGNVVTVDTTEYIYPKYAIKRDPNQNYEVVGASAEGSDTISVGGCSHAEGARTIASGVYSHAEGCQTIASGGTSHAEGNGTIASGAESHAEGTATIAEGRSSHAEGCRSTASGSYSHAEGYNTTASGKYSHTEGYETIANGEYSHAEGNSNIVIGTSSHVEGDSNGVGTSYSHAKGMYNLASNGVSYDVTRRSSNGVFTVATVDGLSVGIKVDLLRSNKPPLLDVAIAKISGNGITLDTTEDTRSALKMIVRNEEDAHKPTYVEGHNNSATGNYSHAEGRQSHAIGEGSHAEGLSNNAIGRASHAEGSTTKSTGDYSHAEGYTTNAHGNYSHAGGYNTTSYNYGSTAIGCYSKMNLKNATEYDATADAFVIGNGTSSGSSNAFRVTFDGATYGLSAFNSSGADYAEYFEWADGNIDNEDRVGYAVTLDGEKIRKANKDDDYILGVVSGSPSVIGDSSQDDWHNKYVKDKWERIVYETIEVEDENGVHEETRMKLNPEWDNEIKYIPREQRKEWDAIGLVGKLLVRDDGTCKTNSYAKVGDLDGVITLSEEPTNIRVMERVSTNVVRVFIK